MSQEEQEIVKKAKKGEGEAFGQLYDKYLTQLYRFIFLKVGNRSDAEDITHQVFLSAWQNIKNYQFQGFPFSSWLYRIALNAVIDYWRTKKNDISIEFVKEDYLISDLPEISELIDRQLDLHLVKNAIMKLEPDQQSVVIMKFVNELSTKEIAHILKKSEGAVRVIQHRALRQLKNLLAKEI